MNEQQKVEEFVVFEENWSAFEMFTKMTTQWVVGPAGVVGFNYTSIEFLFNLYSVDERRQIFEDLQIMELAARTVLNKKEPS